MKVAIISDIHANIHALQAVWEDIESQKPDRVYCLGDLVGYGAYPNEVVEFIGDRAIPTVMRNFDEGIGFDFDDCGCFYQDIELKRLGDQSMKWSRVRTSDENKAFLRSLPMQIRVEEKGPKLLMVHGSPRKISEYLYRDRPQATFEHFARIARSDVIFFGHTHLPYRKKVGRTHFVNAGSVGKPKDGDPRAGYVLAKLSWPARIEYRRVKYDVASAVKAIRDAGLPEQFALVLEQGGLHASA
jgi:putative phosphoesterase